METIERIEDVVMNEEVKEEVTDIVTNAVSSTKSGKLNNVAKAGVAALVGILAYKVVVGLIPKLVNDAKAKKEQRKNEVIETNDEVNDVEFEEVDEVEDENE